MQDSCYNIVQLSMAMCSVGTLNVHSDTTRDHLGAGGENDM